MSATTARQEVFPGSISDIGEVAECDDSHSDDSIHSTASTHSVEEIDADLASVKEYEANFGLNKPGFYQPDSNTNILKDDRNFSINIGQLGTGEGRVSKREDYKHFYDDAPLPMPLGIPEIDQILAMGTINLRQHSQLIQMWGCHACWMRGTDKCPHSIADGKRHANKYCDYAIKSNLIKVKLTGSSNGLKYLRNLNLLQMQDLCDYYLLKLHKLKQADKITKTEIYLWKNILKTQDSLGDRFDKAIKQDEGTKHVTERRITPSDLNSILAKANAQKAKEEAIEAEVVDGDDGKKGDKDE